MAAGRRAVKGVDGAKAAKRCSYGNHLDRHTLERIVAQDLFVAQAICRLGGEFLHGRVACRGVRTANELPQPMMKTVDQTLIEYFLPM